MNLLIVGSGGREHALALKLYEENKDIKMFISPGNGGTAGLGINVKINLSNRDEIVEFCTSNSIDLVVVGPEQPLVDGVADHLRKNNIPVFGPNKEAARIEGDKEFAKKLMSEYNIPTAEFNSFDKNDFNEALDYVKNSSFPVVIKASGLAAGKGVIICDDYNSAESALNDMMNNSIFGEAGDKVVIEEFLTGEELSVFVVTDGDEYLILPLSQDHKRIGEADTGKNTGGMGAYSPVGFADEKLITAIEDQIIKPTLNGLKDKSSKFNGCLYCGLINTPEGVKVIEFNCRFGDPEIQAVLQLIEGDFLELLLSTAQNKLNKGAVRYNGGSAMCVVAASGGYPDKYLKGYPIKGISSNSDELKIIHAGTAIKDDQLITSGGRVLNVVGVSRENDLSLCKSIVYDALAKVYFKDMYFRKDIGFKAGV